MNFYKHHIGDYAKKTGGLTLAEHGAYLLMLHVYYGTEKPLPANENLYRILRAFTKSERAAVDSIAKQFWKKTPEGYVNGRAFAEIESAQEAADHSRKAGRLGGNPKKKAGYNEPGHIYAIQRLAGGAVKVGISKHISARLTSLRHKLGGINVLRTDEVNDMGAAEAAVHKHFLGRLDGEWIDATWPEIYTAWGRIIPAYQAEIHESDSSLIQTPDSKERQKTGADAPDPEGLDPEAFGRFLAYRRGIKKPVRPASLLALKRKLAAMGDAQAAAVDESIAQGWTGVFAPKDRPTSNGSIWRD